MKNAGRLFVLLFTFAVVLSVALKPGIHVEAAGTWTLTGSMSTTRNGHTATRLQDGRVLVAGAHATAEIYDPTTGTWSLTGSTSTVLSYHTATLLTNGRVLVVGGHDGISNLNKAEIYDPATGIWSLTGSMSTVRSGHTSTLLSDGRVLVAGGGDNNGGNVASAEIYDPSAGTWSLTGSMNTVRIWHAATLLSDGRVLVAGGGDNSGTALDSSEIYNPSTGTWSLTGSMNTARGNGHTATLISGGRVLVDGGHYAYGPPFAFASAEIWDPTTGAWSLTNPMSTPRNAHTATLLSDGRVLVAGGYDGGALDSAEIYDPSTGTWSLTGSMNTTRGQYTATLLSDGRVLVAGGFNGGPLASAELYDGPPPTPTITCGKVKGEGSLSNVPRSSFDIEAKIKTGGGPTGQIKYEDKNAGLKFVSTQITTIVITGNHATITGTGKVNGFTKAFQVDVDDILHADTFKIQWTGYTKSGPVHGEEGIKVKSNACHGDNDNGEGDDGGDDH